MDAAIVRERLEGACERIEEAARDARAAAEWLARLDGVSADDPKARELIDELRARHDELATLQRNTTSDLEDARQRIKELNAQIGQDEIAHCDEISELNARIEALTEGYPLVLALCDLVDVLVGTADLVDDPREFGDVRAACRRAREACS